MTELVTVFTSSWNHGEFLADAMRSVLNQSYSNIEYVVIDDGSDDDSLSIMRDFEDRDYRVRCISLPKQPNVGHVLNAGLREMRGEFWVWCPADDILHPGLIEAKWRESVALGHRAVIYSDWEVIGGPEVRLKHIGPDEFALEMQLSCPIGMTGVWVPKRVFSRVGPFPEHLPCSEDFAWVLSALDAGVEFHHIPSVLYSKRKHPNSITARSSGIIGDVVESIRRG